MTAIYKMWRVASGRGFDVGLGLGPIAGEGRGMLVGCAFDRFFSIGIGDDGAHLYEDCP